MRSGLRKVRQTLGSMVVLAVVLGSVGYVIYAANGILDQVEARDTREQHDRYIVHTATALAEQLATAADTALQIEQSSPQVLIEVTETPALPAISADTPTVEPATATPSEVPTDTATATQAVTETLIPSDTPPPTARMPLISTNTPVPTQTPRPTATPIPTNTPRIVPTQIPTNTPRPSFTPTPTDTPSPTATWTPSVTPTFTATHTPTFTPTPTFTYTPTPTFTATIPPTATYVIQGTYALPVNTPVVEIPPRVPLLDTDPDVVNFLLLGSDTSGGGVGHTDVIILVSVNKRAGTVAMWHIPRDLFVYIPDYTMERINLAYALGEQNHYPGGGFGLMKETILYNLGIEVDHYARVNFDGFMQIIKELGGLDVSVDCAIADWRLKDPELDPLVEDNWEYYTLPIGRQRLSPYMALWYVRSRKTTSDLDRGRRQMDVLRALWYQAREQGLFAQVTQLWPEATQVVETDMTLTDVLGLAPLAVSLDMSNIARYSGTRGVHYIPFLTPDDGRDVVLPDRDTLVPLIQDFLTPPTENRLKRKLVTVDVIDASAYGLGFDQVAADRLAWEGFAARPVRTQIDRILDLSQVYDYTGQTKGSALADLMRVLRVSDTQVIAQPDPNRTVDYRVEIGRSYDSCVYGGAEDEIQAGPPIPTATPSNTTNVG
jgi:LCP family protein required for cell wall assembly